jgi:hypothetical protein
MGSADWKGKTAILIFALSSEENPMVDIGVEHATEDANNCK